MFFSLRFEGLLVIGVQLGFGCVRAVKDNLLQVY